jgi:hypothetical protein
MASLEIYKLWQNKATAIAASEEYVGWNGIEYDSVISQLRANPFMSADQVAVATAQSAINLGGERTWSAAAVDGRLSGLLTAADQFARRSMPALPPIARSTTAHSDRRARCGRRQMDKDLYDMAAEINRTVSDPGSRPGHRR